MPSRLKKQWPSAKHRKASIQWCERDQHWTFQDWRKAIFTDKSTFYTLQRKTEVKIWRTDDERLLPDCIQQMNNGDNGKVGISGNRTTIARILKEL